MTCVDAPCLASIIFDFRRGLLSNYEYAQDLAGEAFADMGMEQGRGMLQGDQF